MPAQATGSTVAPRPSMGFSAPPPLAPARCSRSLPCARSQAQRRAARTRAAEPHLCAQLLRSGHSTTQPEAKAQFSAKNQHRRQRDHRATMRARGDGQHRATPAGSDAAASQGSHNQATSPLERGQSEGPNGPVLGSGISKARDTSASGELARWEDGTGRVSPGYASDEDNDDVPRKVLAQGHRKGQGSFLWGALRVPALPARYWTVAQASLAFVLANMDKVNMSVAIIPMAHQFAWNASTAGLVQSSFFWGYALSLVPSGWLAARFTGQRVLKGGVVLWSLATAVVPWCTGSMPLLMFSRALVGFGEGVAPPAATDLVARTMPARERTRAVSAVFNGFNVGSILGLLAAPILIDWFGWESVFYLFGAAGIAWSVWFNPPADEYQEPQQQDLPGQQPAESPAQLKHTRLEPGTKPSADAAGPLPEQGGEGGVPWRAILRRRAVWALVFVHVAQNWGHFCLLAWLPTFYNEGLHLDLGQSAFVSMLPPILSVAVSTVAAPAADSFVQAGTDVTLVRKVAQGTAFMTPALCLGLVAVAPTLNLALPSWAVVLLLSFGLGSTACSYAGLYCAHQDMSKRYASVLLGITTMCGALPGIVGVPLTGILFDATNSWALALFLPCLLFCLAGTVVFSLFGDCRPQHFEREEAERKALLAQ